MLKQSTNAGCGLTDTPVPVSDLQRKGTRQFSILLGFVTPSIYFKKHLS